MCCYTSCISIEKSLSSVIYPEVQEGKTWAAWHWFWTLPMPCSITPGLPNPVYNFDEPRAELRSRKDGVILRSNKLRLFLSLAFLPLRPFAG